MFLNSKEQQAVKDGGFYNNKDHTWNSIITFPGDSALYRHRVETIVVRNNKEVFVKKCTNEKYFLPGGSTEKGISNEEQAIRECNEEAHINVKNIKFTGITYKEKHEPPTWAKEQCDVLWNGSYSEVYTAEYDGKFTGDVEKVDENPFIRSGRWFSFKDCFSFFRKEHAKALTQYIKDQEAIKDEEVVSESYITNYFSNKRFLKKVAKNRGDIGRDAVEDLIKNIKSKNIELKNTSKVQRIMKNSSKAKEYFFPILSVEFDDCAITIALSYDYSEFSPAAATHTDNYGEVVIIYPGFYKERKEVQIFTLLHEIGHIRMYHTIKRHQYIQFPGTQDPRLKAMNKGKVVYPELNADLYAILNGASMYAILSSTTSKDYDDQYDYRFSNQELANRYSDVFNKFQKLVKESGFDNCENVSTYDLTALSIQAEAMKMAIYEMVYNVNDSYLTEKDKSDLYSIILEYGVIKEVSDNELLKEIKSKYKSSNKKDDKHVFFKEYVDLGCKLKANLDSIEYDDSNKMEPASSFYKNYYINEFTSMLEKFDEKLSNNNLVLEKSDSRERFLYLIESITASERNKIKLSKFGIPEERKYPLDTKKHVISAIRLFGHCDPKYKDELAENIIKAMKKYKIDFNMVGEKSSLYPYVKDYIK